MRLIDKLEKYLVVINLVALVFGILMGVVSPLLGRAVNSAVSLLMDGYGVVAPVAIFLILTPALSRIFRSASGGKFSIYTIQWLAIRKFLASFWAVIFTTLVFGLVLLPTRSPSLMVALTNSGNQLGMMVIQSPYFYAMYASILVSVISLRVTKLSEMLSRVGEGVEQAGSLFAILVPLFMFAIGAYIVTLPADISDQIQDVGVGSLQEMNILGIVINPSEPIGMITAYVMGSLLVGLGCFIWHWALLLLTRHKEKRFSINRYFRDYWIKVYPLLWATSSEALATPLNLYLVKRYAHWVKPPVRRFVIGIGGYMNINGTIISVFVLTGLVASILHVQVSMFELLLVIPVIFLISYGIPGIPGELVIFAGPLTAMLGLSPEILPIFLALYIGLQIGLPDSFRTGNNSTDDAVCAILLNKVYEEKFLDEEGESAERPLEKEIVRTGS